MIVTCPGCQKNYQISEEKLAGGAKRIRCRNCKEVFTIHPPQRDDSPPEEAPSSPPPGKADERAARFARVLASDMLIYNQEAVERARAEGNLAEVMAGDLKRSWDLWKTRFPEAAHGEGIKVFRAALRAILAGGGNEFDLWNPPED